MTPIGESAPSEKELNKAARQLRARLESMLENLPPDDPDFMPIARLEQTRRWDRRHKGVSARQGADMRREGGRPRRGNVAGKTATPSFYMRRFERVQ